MSKSKQKGTAAETAVVNYMRDHGFPGAERRALNGNADKGDINAGPGLCIEVKAHKRYSIPEWMTETAIEAINARADYGVLIIKPVGVGTTRTADWWCVMSLEQMLNLLRDAGYGDAR